MSIRLLITLLGILNMVGCAATNIQTEDTDLEEGTGILITNFHTNIGQIKHARNISLRIYHKSDMPEFLTEDLLGGTMLKYKEGEDNLVLIKIPVGEATIGQIQYMYHFVRKYADIDNENSFTIKAGRINYIGDFEAIVDGSKAYIRYFDNQATVANAKSRYPELFEKYEYVESFPKNNRGQN